MARIYVGSHQNKGIQNYTNYTVMARIYVGSHQNKGDLFDAIVGCCTTLNKYVRN